MNEQNAEQAEGTTIIDKTMSITAANLWGNTLAIPVFVIFFISFTWVNGETFGSILDRVFTLEGMGELRVAIFIIVFFLISVVVHELLHGVGYLLAGARWQDVKFGFKVIVAYAHCKIPLPLAGYRLAVLLPGLLLGIIPGIYGIFANRVGFMLYGALMTAAALGDALILWLLRDAPAKANVLDHPSRVGCELHIYN